ncbi:MAG: Ig-like domain-containing protein [Chloroflexota bacterium]|nr:Ig-like domain-containing protein [Chloroflexota bacterium]
MSVRFPSRYLFRCVSIVLTVWLALWFVFPPAVAPAAGLPAPQVLGWSPGVERALPLTSAITVYFNSPMNGASLLRAWRLEPAALGTLRPGPTSLSFAPSRPLHAGTPYRLTIGTQARDLQGAGLAAPFRLTLRTSGSLTVESEVPFPSTSGVPTNGVIAMTFNRPMVPLAGIDAGTGNPAGWHISIDPATPGHGSWLGTSTWVFRPDEGLRPSSRYVVTLSGTIRDQVGEPLGHQTRWSFRTIRPEIVGISPHRAATYADPRTPIQVVFNQPMDRSSVRRLFSMHAGSSSIEGTFSWRGSALFFQPTAPLNSSRPYHVVIGAGVRSANHLGSLARPLAWHFSVAPAPRVLLSNPAPGHTMSGQIQLYFASPMNQTSLDRHLILNPALGQQYTSLYPPSDGTPAADEYTVSGDFRPSAPYTLTISAGVRDRFGRSLPGPYVLHFKTPPIAPSVALYGLPGTSAIGFTSGRTYDAPIQFINVPKVHYTLIRTEDSSVLSNCGPCNGLTGPSGKTVRHWTETVPDPLNKVENLTVHLAQKDGSPLPPGLYWLSAQAPYNLPGSSSATDPPNSYELVEVANVSVTEKAAANGTLVWVDSANTGNPLPGARVKLMAYDGSTIASGLTDGNGLHMFHTVTNQRAASATVDDGTHFGVTSAQWQPNVQPQDPLANPLQPCCQYSPSGGSYAYTDRPVYRPGQTVHFRALLWHDSDGVYSLLGRRQVTIWANDAVGHALYRGKLQLDPFGTVHGSFRLPPGAATGQTFIQFSLPKSNYPGASASFSIAYYRKPEFLTTVSSAASQYVKGQTAHLTAHVRYVFGAPVIRQPVSWTAYTQPNPISPPGYDGYQFYDWESLWNDQPGNSGSQSQFGAAIGHGRGLTDGTGRLSITLPIQLRRDRIDQSVTVEATTTDITHQSVSGRAGLNAYRAASAIGLAPRNQTIPAGQAETVDVVTVRQDGTPVPRQVLEATIFKRTYTTQLAQSGASAFWKAVPHDTAVTRQTLTTNAKGQARLTFTPRDGGEYRIVVRGTDSLGNPVSTATSISVSAAGFSDWGQTNDVSVTLKPDKLTYAVGDVAHILVPAPFDNATALVTLERGNIRLTRVEHLATNSSSIAIPITLDDLPNVYVTVTLYRGWRDGSPPEWRYGVANLRVKVDPRHLMVRLSQARAHLHPGDRASYMVTATDSRGRPVSAEISLALVDTAVLALQPENSPDILRALYSVRSLGVQTDSDGTISVDHLTQQPNFPIQPVNSIGNRAVQGAARAAASFGRAGGGGPPSALYVRSHFADTAYWTGDLHTDSSGRAAVSLRLPDNATTWRLDARGLTAGQVVGQGTLRTVVSQDLVLRPVTPRFLTVGDTLRAGTALNNNLDRSVGVTVSLSARGLDVRSDRPVHVTLPAHGARLVLWPVQVQSSSSASLLLRAIPDSRNVRGDAVALRLPVYPPLTDETVASSGEVFDSIRQYLVLPPDAVARPGALTVQISSALTSGLGSLIQEFGPWPDESNDDVANRLLVASALWTMPRDLTGLSRTGYYGLPTVKRYATLKLVANQYPDGGWPWYNDPFIPSDPVITADAVQALAASGLRGPAVRSSLAQGRGYLRNNLTQVSPAERAHLLLVLALAGGPDRPAAESLYADTIERAHLDSGALADLGRALALSGDRAKGRTVASSLDSRAVASATGAHWEASSSAFWYQPIYAITAASLGELLTMSPNDSFVPASVRWLMLARHGGAWDCQHDTAEIVSTLASYSQLAREGQAHYRYRVEVRRLRSMDGGYTAANQRQTATLTVPVRALRSRARPLLLVSRQLAGGSLGTGPMYYLARLHYYLPAARIAARSEGIAVGRRYFDLRGHPITSIRAGAVAKVQLTIHTDQTLEYLDVEDPLPAGFEPVDGSLQTSQQGLIQPPWYFPYESGTGQFLWFLDHTDLRDNRVSLYAGYLPAGTYTYTYLAQATVPGTYAVAPTHASETFFPEVFGRGAGQSVTVR